MKNLSVLVKSATIVFSIIALFAFVVPQDQKSGGAWEIPAKYKAMKNAAKGDAASETIGKNLSTILSAPSNKKIKYLIAAINVV
jgi:hypothetical protein